LRIKGKNRSLLGLRTPGQCIERFHDEIVQVQLHAQLVGSVAHDWSVFVLQMGCDAYNACGIKAAR